MRFLHTADLHFSPKAEKLEETTRTTDFILAYAQEYPPDVAILAGDSADCYDGPIRLDSPTAKALFRFVQGLADVCPVLVVSGTPSHDKDVPVMLRELRGRHPIHVATEIGMVSLCPSRPGEPGYWFGEPTDNALALFTCLPTVDKARLYATNGASSRAEGNAQARELLSDLFGEIGKTNAEFAGSPRIAVGHGMITGAQFSTGQTAIGEDLEYGVSDLMRLGCDYYAWGHIHKHQCFADGRICYAGSPGRLNFGEVEEKGFMVGELVAGHLATRFVPTPARRFAMKEAKWDDDWKAIDILRTAEDLIEEGVDGAHVRFRYSVPEEHATTVPRGEIEKMLRAAGAAEVKIEATIIPKVRQRAEGISRAAALRDKVAKWGESVGEAVPEDVLALVDSLAAKEVDDLVQEALTGIEGPIPLAEGAGEGRRERILEAMDGFVRRQAGESAQTSLF